LGSIITIVGGGDNLKAPQIPVKIVSQSKNANKSASAHKQLTKPSTKYIFDYYESSYIRKNLLFGKYGEPPKY
jgi:hypothetical protein